LLSQTQREMGNDAGKQEALVGRNLSSRRSGGIGQPEP
jgi:hypothetical protein